MRAWCFALVLGTAAACGTKEAGPLPGSPGAGLEQDAGSEGGSEPESFPVITLPAEPQRPGDPQKGYAALVNYAYVPCGVPYSAYRQVFGPAPAASRLPGRTGRNAELAYDFTAFTTKDNVELVGSNCLSCHAGRINGELVVGLGKADGDFTQAPGQLADAVGFLVTDPRERAEWQKWKERVQAISDWSVLDTVGPNPADAFTAALFAHHDPKTLVWSNEPVLPLPPKIPVPVDVPPWWRMKKKNAMFYVGGGRGDHARIEMTASILCSSSVEESREIDAYFGDIRAYIASIEAPEYPFAIDRALAERGRAVFESTCATCHGTYGDHPSYPNRLIPLAQIGTDNLLASGAAQFSKTYTDWFAQSFFGETARLEPQAGYVAPPLDGIWATAPFFHNGSVPTLEAVLDSSKRPAFWTRTFDSKDYDPAAVGWRFTALDHGKSEEPNAEARRRLYDTTQPGYANTGHLFGDPLSVPDRTAVLEYLKTL